MWEAGRGRREPKNLGEGFDTKLELEVLSVIVGTYCCSF